MTDRDEYRFYRTVGELIQASRKEAGLTQADLAAVIGHSRVSIANIEAGKQRCELWDLARMAREMCIDPANLLPPEWRR